jgi:hypothetical protein
MMQILQLLVTQFYIRLNLVLPQPRPSSGVNRSTISQERQYEEAPVDDTVGPLVRITNK